MNLSAPFIRRPVMTTLCAVTAIVLGIYAYRTLPTSSLPDAAYPVINVTTNYPGASPEIIANNISTPLEIQMMQIQGLQVVTSNNMEGVSSIVLQFDLDKSLTSAATDVQAAIQRAMGNLPADLPAPPAYTLNNPNNRPIVYLSLTTDTMTLGDLYDYANNVVAQRMTMISGVSQAMVYGSARAIRIKVDANALASRGLALTDIASTVKLGSVFKPGGVLYGPSVQYTVDPKGQLLEAKDFNNLIVSYQNGTPVKLADIAHVENGVASEYMLNRYWSRRFHTGSAAIVIAITAAPGSNAVEVATKVRETVKSLRSFLPGSISLEVINDLSVRILASIDDVKMTILIAFLLVLGVIFIFLGRFRETVIPAIALPIALALTLAIMKALGYSLDNLSLMALTLAVGFLVDDAIVVLENTVRHLEMGKTPIQAALEAAKEISFTVFSMTLSLAAVFIPLLLMGDLMGRMMREFSMTIVIAILMSGVVAITVSPLMCARLLEQVGEGQRTWMERKMADIFVKLQKGYGSSLHWVMRRRWLGILLWIVCLIGTVLLYLHVPKTFLPAGDSGELFGVFLCREGTSALEMQRVQDKITELAKNFPFFNEVITVANISEGSFLPSMGVLWTKLKPAGKRPPIEKVADELNAEILRKVPGVMPLIRPDPSLRIDTGATSDLQGDYAFTMTGLDPKLLYRTASTMLNRLREQPGFANISSDMRLNAPFLEVEILRDKASSYGLTAGDIEQTLQLALAGARVNQIMMPLNQYDIDVELLDHLRRFPEDLNTLRMRGANGQDLIPLSSVVRLKSRTGPESINHLNQLTAVNIYYNLKPGYPVEKATAALRQIAREVLPAGVSGTSQGSAQQFEQLVKGMSAMLVVAIFVIYLILGILYESYIHPITVLSTVPTAGAGGLLILYLAHMPLSLYGFIGLFLLLGIVKKNAIMVVDFAIQRMKEGLAMEEAVIEACHERLRPILMTTFAAILGAVPLAIGFGADGASRRPLGLCIVVGLVVSQILTLFVTPVFYTYLEEFQTRILDKIPLFRRAEKEFVSLLP
ncbi:MAG: acriflavine resistance protein B [Verrucomicrobia bacterium]|nr:MAG: acriflavine resistance protein B [Verrucomicrobiota bacterium]